MLDTNLAPDQNTTQTKLLDKQVYESLRKNWDHYREVQLSQDDKFIRGIMTISGGVFAISFTFINQLIPWQAAYYKGWLIFGWSLFALTLALAVLCHFVSSLIHRAYYNDISKRIEDLKVGKHFKRPKKWYDNGKFMIKLEGLALALFLGGMVCLILFVALNHPIPKTLGATTPESSAVLGTALMDLLLTP